MGEISQSLRVNGVRVNALYDSGATGNYLSSRLAKRVRLYLEKNYSFEGIDGIKHTGRIAHISVDIMGREGSTRVVVTDILPNDGFDVILGQPFLQDNEVVLDYKKDKMRFTSHQPKLRRIGRI